jgi:hypothetical protein
MIVEIGTEAAPYRTLRVEGGVEEVKIGGTKNFFKYLGE